MKDVRLDHALLAGLRKRSARERRQLGAAIATAQKVFGSPHAHSGIGLRKLRGPWYDVRAGLQLRLLFRDCDDCLSFEFLGDHDEVQRFLKSAR